LPEAPNEVSLTLLLCEAAQAVAGKLYVLGGGWRDVKPPAGAPIPMALAMMISVPWNMANQKIELDTRLLTAAGEPVDLGDGPVQARATIEVGRPPGVEPGTSLDTPLALNTGLLPLAPGSYVWHVEAGGDVLARAPFRVLA
jgi:hypothetical protein